MLNSKELLEKTGISRATLNNYIALGIVPKPDVLPPEPADGSAPRIGYFPDETLQRIAEIQRLKNEGWSMAAIAERFASGRPASVPAATRPVAGGPAPSLPAALAPARAGPPLLDIEESGHPAYLVDRNFALVWTNAASASLIGRGDPGRNLFGALLGHDGWPAASREEALRFHLGIAKQVGAVVPAALRPLPEEQQTLLRRLEAEIQPLPAALVAHAVLAEAGRPTACLYAVQFRQGTLFVHVSGGRIPEQLTSLLGGREPAAAEAGRRRRPVLSEVAVLAMELDDATRIWSALPAEEYFELINEIWLMADPIVRRHHGVQGKHPGDGLVCYFLAQRDTGYAWNAVQAADEIREAMRRVSKGWQLRKGWTTELALNVGLDEGQQWLGSLGGPGQLEFTMFGDPLNRAVRISDFARFGAIWASKNLIVKLAPEDRRRVVYGVHRRDKEGRHAFVPSVFSTVDRLADVNAGPGIRLHDIARLPITEIVEIASSERRRERAADAPNH